MADENEIQENEQNPKGGEQTVLEGGTYEIIRSRLNAQAKELRERVDKLNAARKEVFGAIPTTLIATERVTTVNNCVPRDMIAVGKGRFLFGYNVRFGLKTETKLEDVIAGYQFNPADHTFSEIPLDFIGDEQFHADFKQLYKYYKKTVFVKFSKIGPSLFMVFRIGESVTDIKTFKWAIPDDELIYQGNRSDHEFVYPSQHEFEWVRTHRDLHRSGVHPHISVDDRVFVECVGGDLTVKIEDNTSSGEGIYAEPVVEKDQTLDDAEIFYAIVGNLILLKIRPYQETEWRHLVFNEKINEVRRIDAVEDSCILLPDDQGIIFSNGYYLQLGDMKQFPSELENMLFERRSQAPNGEDYLYVFYNRLDGAYMLMSYNIISQAVEAPIVCHGFSTFENGELAYFKASDDPQKHHTIQVWSTPYVASEQVVDEKQDSHLYKIGNPSIVRCMSECQEILTLLGKEDSYADLYVDIVKKASDIVDAYFWVDHQEAFNLKETLGGIKGAAAGAIDEFEKVKRLKKNALNQLKEISTKGRKLLDEIAFGQLESINDFVEQLAGLRTVRGELISLKEVRYMDVKAVEALETEVTERAEDLSNRCVDFLLQEDALSPYDDKVRAHEGEIDKLTKVAEAKELEESIVKTGQELEMLIEIVSNLKIDDATQTTRIIDNISGIYAPLNQIKATLKRRKLDLQKTEGAAQFTAQLRLLDQSVVNYLEVCDSPAKCEEYLTKIMIQLEELEGKFADFDDYILQLSEKRDELYSAFESRKLALMEARNKRATTLMSAAERILKGIQNRVENMKSINDINGYYASDLMVDKVRDIIDQLTELEDTVKAGEIQARLKTIREDAVRQLKDRQELFVDGKNIIQFGKHKFSVNTQNLDLTMVLRDGEMFYHLSGTDFFEQVTDEEFLATRPVWDQETISETREVYRAEFLAYQILTACERADNDASGSGGDGKTPLPSLAEIAGMELEDCKVFVQKFMASRYSESYVKGVHDTDAAQVVSQLASMHGNIGLLRYPTDARACATVFWSEHAKKDPVLAAKLKGFGVRNQLFPGQETQNFYIQELQALIRAFCEETKLFDVDVAEDAGEYLFYDLTNNDWFVVSRKAADIYNAFENHIKLKRFHKKFEEAREGVRKDLASSFRLIRDWAGGYLNSLRGTSSSTSETSGEHESLHAEQPSETVSPEVAEALSGPELDPVYLDEAVAVLLRGKLETLAIVDVSAEARLPKLVGNHAVIQDGSYYLDYNAFMVKLQKHERVTAPLFHRYHDLKSKLIDDVKHDMRLEEFQPRVLSSFVRNRLIDKVYLPIIGDNLAKQMGTVGENTRTDRMGLLLLISPPGYGKTTLMEYIANRMGIIFMKINGPAIGHNVTSLDPTEAPNASSREEMEKLNLSLEMGDNVMLYLDDIQHTNPELLQKFISLCDAQRKIEGVYKGRAKTYDLRGKKVCVVMAGNPYTESGEKFQIPDMLANRADTYNLGDIIGETADDFEASYIENSLTSNSVLAKLGSRSQKDVHAIMKIAETDSREGINLEGNFSVEEINEMVSVMKKLMTIRDTVLGVNLQYIASAAQSDDYRTEPPFKMQGSYRNMNRMAEKVLPIMNDQEIADLINDHYKNEAQTLTSGAEANILKFKELRNAQTDEDKARWAEIKKTFKKNILLGGASEDDPVSRVVAQLTTFSDGLDQIKEAIGSAVKQQADLAAARAAEIIDVGEGEDAEEAAVDLQGEALTRVVGELASFSKGLGSIEKVLAAGLQQQQRAAAAGPQAAGKSDALEPLSQSLAAIEKVLAETLGAKVASAADAPDALATLGERFAAFAKSLNDIKKVLADGVKSNEKRGALRVIDAEEKTDYEITSVSRETLKKVWEIIAAERQREADKNKGAKKVVEVEDVEE
ncbi:MAG: MoxR-like ATPase [Candidatus Binatia bacterium]|jgi:MoxR-like ATPase